MRFLRIALILLSDQILRHPKLKFYPLDGDEITDYGNFYYYFSEKWIRDATDTLEKPIDIYKLQEFTINYVTEYVNKNAIYFLEMSYEELDDFIGTLTFDLMGNYFDEEQLIKHFPSYINKYPKEWKERQDPSRKDMKKWVEVWRKEDMAKGLHYPDEEYAPFDDPNDPSAFLEKTKKG